MKRVLDNYKPYIKDKKFLKSILFGFLLIFASLFVNYYAGLYATERASNSVTDIVLSNIPVFQVDDVFIYGTFIFWLFISILCLIKPNRIPFVLKSISVFVITRSIFITMTHIGPFPIREIISGSDLIKKFTFGGDLFFSGHTGLPFLMALIFWKEEKVLHWICLGTSLIFGAIVLMGHLHYTIDVLSAFFITYTIFHISERFFAKDRLLFFEKGN